MIMRISLVLFPLIHGWPADQNDVFTLRRLSGFRAEREYQQKRSKQKAGYHRRQTIFKHAAKFRKLVGAIAERAGDTHSLADTPAFPSLPLGIDLAADQIFPCLPSSN